MPSRHLGHLSHYNSSKAHGGKRGHNRVRMSHNKQSPGGVAPTTAVDTLSSAKSIISGNRHSVMTKTNSDQTVLTRATQLVKSRQMTVQTRLTPDAQLPNAWAPTNNSYMDFRIMPSQNIHYLNDLWFQFTVKNPELVGGLNMILGPWYQMFDRIELLADGTSTQDQIYPLQAFLMTACSRKDEERAMAAQNEGINRDTDRDSTLDGYLLTNYDAENHGTGITLAPQETRVYRFKIGSILDYADLFLPTLSTWPTIRFYFGGTNFQMSTSPTLATNYPLLADAILLVSGTFLGDPQQVQTYKDYYNSYPSISQGMMYDRQTLQPFTPTSNQETGDQVLTGISGKMAGLFITMAPQNVANENQFSPGGAQTFANLDKITFKQMDGTVQSFEKQDVDFFRRNLWMRQWPSCVSLEKCILWYPFCDDPLALVYHGTDTGSYQMTTREIIKLIPLSVTNNTLVPATNYVITIFALRYGQLLYHMGKLQAFKLDDNIISNVP